MLELHASDGSLITTNDNWMELDQSAINDLEANHLAPSDSRESAIVAMLAPGAYTGIVRGKDDTEGIALAEAYDVTARSHSQVGNISTRGFVQIEDNVMIGGFELGQNPGDAHIVVRALGPSLADYGIPDTLADPTLELRDSEGNLLSMNDNWPEDPAQAALITSKGLAPKNMLESAAAIDLPAGGYTVIVRGNNAGTGVGLVEVYNTP